jgi:hypothetical protein
VTRRALLLGVVLATAVFVAGTDGPPNTALVALVNAHAHNDYEHARPLLDALDHGFCSVEADVFLVNGDLLVAHDADHERADQTLEALYLDPLRERVWRNDGHLYPQGPDCTLLIDVKSQAEATYAVLRDVLARYADILTRFRGDTVDQRALTVIVSGNVARATMAAEAVRYAAVDGTLADLDSGASPALVPWISGDWQKLFTWSGSGAMPTNDERLLRSIVNRAHAQGRKVRFWNAPDSPLSWTVLLGAGVDLINTDDLVGLERLLRGTH